ncbi:MAG: phosphoribosylformylglycinamidine synthase subunit PurQ, partial [Acidobacteria bacterium]|nr:phosphoribosylformylglycinamidine synthase subunit PurQ [Acidobacteriota bacterium]
NCDHEAQYMAEAVLGQQVRMVWHKETALSGIDAVILPGGFSHGDYLRTGAIARFSPIMGAVKAFAEQGGPVIGICNGFQILQESGLLPGAMLRNADLRFHCEYINIRVEQTDTPFTRLCTSGQVLRVPISHGEGNFFADADVIAQLEQDRRIIFRYSTVHGDIVAAANPNGSIANIAGVCNETRNVVGLMPHPERACERRLGSDDGLVLFRSVMDALATSGAMAV